MADLPEPLRFWRWRQWGRAIAHVLRRQPSSALAAVGTVSAFGAGAVALGLSEISGGAHDPSPLKNGWVLAGAIILLCAALLAVGIFLSLIATRVKDEEHRVLIIALQYGGTLFLNGLDPDRPVPTTEIDAWRDHAQDVLRRIEPTGGLLIRFMNPAGLPPAAPTLGPADYVKYATFLRNRTARLNEFIAELEH